MTWYVMRPQFLASNRLNLDIQGPHLWTPLHLAVFLHGPEALIEKLLIRLDRAQVNAPLVNGCNALYLAIERYCALPIIALLLRFGANPNLKRVSRGRNVGRSSELTGTDR